MVVGMTLRILIVTDVYPPLIGGVELQMQWLAQKLQEYGHEVVVATAWQVNLPAYERDNNVDVYRLKGFASRISWFSTNPQRRHHPPLPDPATVWGLRRIINRFRPHLIHAYGWITYSCTVALLGKNIPLILSVREYGYTCALRTMMRYGKTPCSGPAPARCLDCAVRYYGLAKGLVAATGVAGGRFLLRYKLRAVHSVSTYVRSLTRRDLLAHTSDQDPENDSLYHVVIPSFHVEQPVDHTTRSDIAAFTSQLPAEPYILFVGALRLVKGLEPLIEAYQQLKSPPPLVLIGPIAPDTPASFPATVKVLYDFPHAAVIVAWQRALFGVAPSIWPEPFGSVIHEAMSQGKAVIGTTPGGQTDMIVEGETGLLVPANDVTALANAMQRLIEDEELRRQLGRAAQKRAKLFTCEIIVPRFVELYKQLAGNRGGYESQEPSRHVDPG